jgi:hypothetical protein
MRSNMVLLVLLLTCNIITAQVSFSKDIAPLIFANCSYCHLKNGYTPFPLESYDDIAGKINSIKYVVDNKIMPPWKPAPDGPKFLNERHLSDRDIKLLNQWIAEGYKCDNRKITYKKSEGNQVFGEPLGKPDLILKPTQPFTQVANSNDVFVSYVLPTGVKKNTSLKAVVLKPGPSKIVHHARLEYDSSGTYHRFSKEHTYFETKLIPDSLTGELPPVGFYVPGLDHIMFPNNSGYDISPKGEFVLFLHYSPVAKTESDQTEIWLYFNKKPVERKVRYTGYVYDYRNTNIPKDSITEITAVGQPAEAKLTIVAVEPHLHLLGQSIRVDILRKNSKDTTLLIKLAKWDFNWQELYFLEKPVVLDTGDRFMVTVVFDNTKNNPRNPFFPPRDVNFGGMATTNEMINVMMVTLLYQEGDEKRHFSY